MGRHARGEVARRTSHEWRDDARRCRDGVKCGQRQGAAHGICATMRERRTLEEYITVCLATPAQVRPVSAGGARIEGVRVVRGGRQGGRTEGHIGRGRVHGARRTPQAWRGVRGDGEIARVQLVYSTVKTGGCCQIWVWQNLAGGAKAAVALQPVALPIFRVTSSSIFTTDDRHEATFFSDTEYTLVYEVSCIYHAPLLVYHYPFSICWKAEPNCTKA